MIPPAIRPGLLSAAAAALLLTACGSGDGLSTREVRAEAEERVRQSLQLAEGSALFTDVFVGEPVEGDTVLCGTVEGRRADGTVVPPRRFIAATEPARWLKFEPVDGNILPSQPDKFIEWHKACTGEAAVD